MFVSRIASFDNKSNFNASNQKNGVLDNIRYYTKNQADMTDTIVVPRTIFKGYLGIMTGTTLITLGIALSQKFAKFSKALNITGLLASLYGTWAFVRPFVLKDVNGVSKR